MCGICFSISQTNKESLQHCQNLHDAVLPQLLRRGPDILGTHEEVVTSSTGEAPLKLFFTGTVLHLRGTPTQQPLRDEHGNILLWNGEIFDGIKVDAYENDTQLLIKALQCPCADDVSLHILNPLSKIRGPWSFIYWEAQRQRVWFGRDYFGRRSLLWQLPTVSNGALSIASVACRSSKSCENFFKWEEVPADGIYCIDFSENFDGQQVFSIRWYSIQKFSWSSPDVRISSEDKLVPELQCPVLTFNTLVPSEEDLNSSMENHLNAFCLRDQRDESKTTFENKSEDFKSILEDQDKSTCCKDRLQLKAPLNYKISPEKSIEAAKLLQLSYQKRNQEGSYNVSEGASGGICEDLIGQKTTPCCQERISDSHFLFDSASIEDKERDKIHTLNTCIESRNDYEANNCQKAYYNLSCESCFKGLNVMEQNNSHFCGEDQLHSLLNTSENSYTILNKTANISKQTNAFSYNSVVSERGDMHKHSCNIFLEAAQKLLYVLGEAVRKRVTCLPGQTNEEAADGCENCPNSSRVGVLFSGGIDSIVIAALADRFVPNGEAIDLINVAFEQRQSQVSSLKGKQKNKKHAAKNETSNVQRFNVPDRLTGRSGLKELQVLNPYRRWNFVEVDVTIDQLQEMRSKYITHLVYPLESVLDDSIGCALWFAARGEGILKCPDCIDGLSEDFSATCSHPTQYCCQAKVLLLGMGADEQLGGYSRHRTRFSQEGWVGLMDELQLEVKRISTRNLGRDDRCVSDHGREARFPFLDEDVVSLLNSLPVWIKTDPRLPRGTGEKILLRHAARLLGLTSSAQLPKRAIQFGSRIAKLESSGEKGSDTCSRLKNNDDGHLTKI